MLVEGATRIWHFKDGEIEDFKGAYEEYLLTAQQKSVAAPQKVR